jgi:hypothetical protein
MLDFACAVCQKRARLTQLAAWIGPHPICSSGCRAKATGLETLLSEREYATKALAALDACRPELEQALAIAYRAGTMQVRAEQLAAQGGGAPNGLLGLMVDSGRAEAENKLREEIRNILQVVGAHVFEIEGRLRIVISQVMGLHALRVPVVGMLQPLTTISILVIEPWKLDAREVHQQLDHLYAVLGAARGAIASSAGAV